MKRIVAAAFATLLAFVLFAGCAAQGVKTLPDLAEQYGKQNPAASAEQTAKPIPTPAASPAAQEDGRYEEFTALLGKNSSPAELIAFLKDAGKSFSAEQARQAGNELLKRINGYFHAQIDTFNHLQQTSKDLYDLTQVQYSAANRVKNEPIDAAEAKYLNELIDNGLMFYFAEGLALDIDAAGFLSLFAPDVTGEAADYMRIVRAEQEKPSMLEGMTEISEAEMIARCETTLDYLDKYPDSPFKEDAEQYRTSYYRAILVQYFGLFDYETGKVRPEAKQTLQAYAAAAKGTKVESVIKDFLTLLEKEGWKKTKAVDDYLLSLGFEPQEVSFD